MLHCRLQFLPDMLKLELLTCWIVKGKIKKRKDKRVSDSLFYRLHQNTREQIATYAQTAQPAGVQESDQSAQDTPDLQAIQGWRQVLP